MNSDAQEVVQEVQKAGILVPAATVQQLPEDVAWSMIAAEGGAVAVLLAIAVVTLWTLHKKGLEETKSQNKELVGQQAKAIEALTVSMTRVETAIQISDNNNQTALKHLGEVVQAAVARLDRHEERLGTHQERLIETHHRLVTLERGAGGASSSGHYPVRPLSPNGRSIDPPQHP